jgi:hypothetical protein
MGIGINGDADPELDGVLGHDVIEIESLRLSIDLEGDAVVCGLFPRRHRGRSARARTARPPLSAAGLTAWR